MRVLRPNLRSAVALSAFGLALPLAAASAQTPNAAPPSDFPNLVPVVIWTAVFVTLSLLLTSVGYLYRRQRGMDHPLHAPAIDIEADHGHGGENPLGTTAGYSVTPHELLDHATSDASDAVTQAAVAHDAGR